MSITAISRDWGSSPSIVRVSTTDNFATITAVGYLADQSGVILEINKGIFEWLDTDVISIAYSDGQSFFTRDPSTETFVAEVDVPPGSITTGMIADDAVTYPKIQNVTATDRVLGRSTAGAGVVEEIPCTAAGRALIDDANAAAQRVTLGLGTVATQDANAAALTGGTLAGISATTFTHTTGSIGTAVTAVTQVPGTNNNSVSTTAYADAAAAGGAPVGATYITQTVNATLTNEQALSLLATGIMKSTTGTGVVSIAAAGTDYVGPATTITVAGTANEITSSAGAQDLSANRTWTLSLPAALTFTGKTITGGTLSGMTATTLTFSTGSIGTAVTGVTQTPLNNSTLLSTTAYVEAAVTAAALPGYTAAAAGNTTLLKFFERTGSGTNYVEFSVGASLTSDAVLLFPGNTANMTAVAVGSTASNSTGDQLAYAPLSTSFSAACTGIKYGTFPFPACKLTSGFALPFHSTGRNGVGVSMVNDTLYATLVYIPMGSYTTVTFNVIVGDVSATADVDVAIYSPATLTGVNNPSVRLLTAGTVSNIGAAGEQTVTFAGTNIAGWYWVVLRPDNIGTALTIDACSGTNIQGFGSSNTNTVPTYGFTYTAVTSMPATITGSPATYLTLPQQLHVAVG